MTQMLGKYRMYEAWGKFDRENDKHHPLAHHCMDVASVFARMTRLPVVRDRLEKAAKTRLDDVQCTRLSALVFLHDIGKLHPGFQAKGWPPELWPAPKRGHLREGWAFLHLAGRWPEHPFHEAMRRMLAWGEAVGPLLAAAIAHHGRPVAPPSNPTLEDWDSPVSPKYDWRAQARSLQGILIQWFAEAFEGSADPLPNQPHFHHAVAGLAALADWIGSDRRFFNYVTPVDPGYDVIAHRGAVRAVEATGLDVGTLADRPPPDFTRLTGFPAPNPAKAVAGAVDSGARLLILEAETGSGKTEAALWRFTQLFAAGRVGSLYFAVPTRAAARQLHGRVVAAMRRVFGEDAPELVLAIPGMLCAGDSEGYRLPGWAVRWDDDTDTAPRRWAAEHATRVLAATVAVGTVDQAMLAGLTVKHAHMRGSALARIHGVYRDLAGLELTRRSIVDRPEWRIPEMNRSLVESATHPDRIAALIAEKGEDWERYERKVGGAALAQAMIADLNGLDRSERFEALRFPDSDERIMTRLGEEGVVFSLDPPVIGPFGRPVARIALPARWSHGIGANEPVAASTDDGDLVLSVGERRFRYAREGLKRDGIDT